MADSSNRTSDNLVVESGTSSHANDSKTNFGSGSLGSAAPYALPSMLPPNGPGIQLSRAQAMQVFVRLLDKIAIRHHRDARDTNHLRLRTDYLDFLGRYVPRSYHA